MCCWPGWPGPTSMRPPLWNPSPKGSSSTWLVVDRELKGLHTTMAKVLASAVGELERCSSRNFRLTPPYDASRSPGASHSKPHTQHCLTHRSDVPLLPGFAGRTTSSVLPIDPHLRQMIEFWSLPIVASVELLPPCFDCEPARSDNQAAMGEAAGEGQATTLVWSLTRGVRTTWEGDQGAPTAWAAAPAGRHSLRRAVRSAQWGATGREPPPAVRGSLPRQTGSLWTCRVRSGPRSESNRRIAVRRHVPGTIGTSPRVFGRPVADRVRSSPTAVPRCRQVSPVHSRSCRVAHLWS